MSSLRKMRNTKSKTEKSSKKVDQENETRPEHPPSIDELMEEIKMLKLENADLRSKLDKNRPPKVLTPKATNSANKKRLFSLGSSRGTPSKKGCKCTGDCSTKRCGCVKSTLTCNEYCLCQEKCKNQETEIKTEDDENKENEEEQSSPETKPMKSRKLFLPSRTIIDLPPEDSGSASNSSKEVTPTKQEQSSPETPPVFEETFASTASSSPADQEEKISKLKTKKLTSTPETPVLNLSDGSSPATSSSDDFIVPDTPSKHITGSPIKKTLERKPTENEAVTPESPPVLISTNNSFESTSSKSSGASTSKFNISKSPNADVSKYDDKSKHTIGSLIEKTPERKPTENEAVTPESPPVLNSTNNSFESTSSKSSGASTSKFNNSKLPNADVSKYDGKTNEKNSSNSSDHNSTTEDEKNDTQDNFDPMKPRNVLKHSPMRASRNRSANISVDDIPLPLPISSPSRDLTPPREINEAEVDWDQHMAQLIQCQKCKRKFYPHRIGKHQKHCAKV